MPEPSLGLLETRLSPYKPLATLYLLIQEKSHILGVHSQETHLRCRGEVEGSHTDVELRYPRAFMAGVTCSPSLFSKAEKQVCGLHTP